MKHKYGFTLVELLVVLAIIGILAAIGIVTFTSSQMRSRDAQRKSDLKQIASALELYYADNASYPAANDSGQILGCPSTSSTACSWGAGPFTDGKTVYFQKLPKDPHGANYFYRVDPQTNPQKFQLFALLENGQDSQIITTNHPCETGVNCNFAITSPNTTPTDF